MGRSKSAAVVLVLGAAFLIHAGLPLTVEAVPILAPDLTPMGRFDLTQPDAPVEVAHKRVAFVGDVHHEDVHDEQFLQLLKDMVLKPQKVFLEHFHAREEVPAQWFLSLGIDPAAYPASLTRAQVRAFIAEREFDHGGERAKADRLYDILVYCREEGIQVLGIDSPAHNTQTGWGRYRQRSGFLTNASWGNRIFAAMEDVDAQAGEYALVYAGALHGRALREHHIMPEIPVYLFEKEEEPAGDESPGRYARPLPLNHGP